MTGRPEHGSEDDCEGTSDGDGPHSIRRDSRHFARIESHISRDAWTACSRRARAGAALGRLNREEASNGQASRNAIGNPLSPRRHSRFVPGIAKDHMFFGVFIVNTPHSLMHVASGAMFLIASMLEHKPPALWFQIFGIVYAVMAAVGFMIGDGMIFHLISNNQYDSWGHSVLAVLMLLIGFAAPRQIIAGQPSLAFVPVLREVVR